MEKALDILFASTPSNRSFFAVRTRSDFAFHRVLGVSIALAIDSAPGAPAQLFFLFFFAHASAVVLSVRAIKQSSSLWRG